MNRMTGTFITIVVCAFLAVVVFFLADLGSEKAFATPEEAFEGARAALKKNDMRGFCQCLTNESRDLVAATSILKEFARKQDPEKATDEQKVQGRAAEEVFKQHGLTEEFLAKAQQEMLILSHPQAPMEKKLDAAQTLLAPVKDRNAFIGDLFKATATESKAGGDFDILKDAKLSPVKITGKTATATFSTARQERPIPMNFRKQPDGGWRLDLFPEEKRGMMPPGMPPGHP